MAFLKYFTSRRNVFYILFGFILSLPITVSAQNAIDKEIENPEGKTEI
jgi:hypothetical protein